MNKKDLFELCYQDKKEKKLKYNMLNKVNEMGFNKALNSFIFRNMIILNKCDIDDVSFFNILAKDYRLYSYSANRNIDLSTGEYLEDENNDPEKEYTLKFLKLPLEDDLDDYIKSGTNYVDYDEITGVCKLWSTGQIQPTACKLRMALIFLNGCLRQREEKISST